MIDDKTSGVSDAELEALCAQGKAAVKAACAEIPVPVILMVLAEVAGETIGTYAANVPHLLDGLAMFIGFVASDARDTFHDKAATSQ